MSLKSVAFKSYSTDSKIKYGKSDSSFSEIPRAAVQP